MDIYAYISRVKPDVKKPNRFRKIYSITLPPELAALAKKRGKETDGGRAQLIQRLLEEWIKAGMPEPVYGSESPAEQTPAGGKIKASAAKPHSAKGSIRVAS
jgi:hypothetical protein